MALKKLPLVIVEWFDIVDHQGWNSTSDTFSPALCVSVGWLISKDKTQVVITETLSPGHDDEGYGQVKSIPMGTVKKVVRVG